MSKISVQLNRMKDIEAEMKNIASKTGQITDSFSTTRYSLDWDVRSRNNIDKDFMIICEAIARCKENIYHSAAFIGTAEKAYQEIELKLARLTGIDIPITKKNYNLLEQKDEDKSFFEDIFDSINKGFTSSIKHIKDFFESIKEMINNDNESLPSNEYIETSEEAIVVDTETEVDPTDEEGGTNQLTSLNEAILLTASFEGSGYVNVTGNSDGQGISMGIFQWNIGSGTLQPLLKQFFENNNDLAQKIFGDDYKSVVNMLDSSKSTQLSWAKSINDGKYLKSEWKKQLIMLCETSEFQAIQREAMSKYINQAYKIVNDYGLKSERGLSLALDIAVQNWDVKSAARKNIKNQISNGLSEQEVLKLLAQAAVDKSKPVYKNDVSSRKFTIVNGTGAVHGKLYDIEEEYGITYDNFE